MFNCKCAYGNAGNLAVKDKQLKIKMHAKPDTKAGLNGVGQRATAVRRQVPTCDACFSLTPAASLADAPRYSARSATLLAASDPPAPARRCSD